MKFMHSSMYHLFLFFLYFSNQAHYSGFQKMQQDIADHFTMEDGTTRLYIGREKFMSGRSGWPIQHDAPYKPQVDRHITSVVEVCKNLLWGYSSVAYPTLLCYGVSIELSLSLKKKKKKSNHCPCLLTIIYRLGQYLMSGSSLT